MECRTPAETALLWMDTAAAKAAKPVGRTLVASVFAGAVIAFGGMAAATASFSLGSPSAMRLAAGLLFPFGLAIIVLLGAELFTGNVLLCVPMLAKKLGLGRVLRNLALVYAGNFAGGLLVAAGAATSGQLGLGGNQLAVYTISSAAAKCRLPFGQAVVLGIFCNVLVCMGVLLAQAAKGVPGKIMGCYLPVCFFVVCGFEHCVANMYSIPAALFALMVPAYAQAAAGVNLAGLSWPGFLAGNLLPVTLGNIGGGVLVALFLWGCHCRPAKA